MEHNINYYNNMNMHNNMFYRPAPLYPNLGVEPIEENKEQTDENIVIDEKPLEEKVVIENEQNASYSTSRKNSKSKENNSREFFSFKNGKINILGFSLDIDDLIIISIIIFLFLENKKDYLLLIVLCLMLFNISTDTFKNMNIVQQLFYPT